MTSRMRWTKARINKLVNRVEVGHRSYSAIAQELGCSPEQASSKYSSIKHLSIKS